MIMLKMRRSVVVFVTFIKLSPFRQTALVFIVVVAYPFVFGWLGAPLPFPGLMVTAAAAAAASLRPYPWLTITCCLVFCRSLTAVLLWFDAQTRGRADGDGLCLEFLAHEGFSCFIFSQKVSSGGRSKTREETTWYFPVMRAHPHQFRGAICSLQMSNNLGCNWHACSPLNKYSQPQTPMDRSRVRIAEDVDHLDGPTAA